MLGEGVQMLRESNGDNRDRLMVIFAAMLKTTRREFFK